MRLGSSHFGTTAFCFGVLLCALPSHALTASQYSAQSEVWREGYVFGIMEALASLTDSDSKSIKVAEAYGQCFQENEINSSEGVRILGRYLLRTPDASAKPMVANVVGAFAETCKRYLSNASLSNP